jgi:diphosphomevalonate decarboxylase
VEAEALMLHAMMMTSDPYFMLMLPNTLAIIQKVWDFRKQTNLHPIITLDAGANVHLLFPAQENELILDFVNNELLAHCAEKQYICSTIGNGPIQILEDEHS